MKNILDDIKNNNNSIVNKDINNKQKVNDNNVNLFYDKIKNEKMINNKDKEIIENQLINNVCEIYTTNKIIGVGFLCIIPYPDKFSQLPVLFMYSETTKKENLTKNKEIQLKFQNNDKILVLYGIERNIYNYNENVMIIEIKKNENFNFNQFFEIDDSKYDNNDLIYLMSNNFKDKYNINKMKTIDDNNYRNCQCNLNNHS